MRITDIKKQVRTAGRFSIYLDGKYSFSLDDHDLMQAKLAVGRELSKVEVESYKELSQLGKLFARCLNYLMIRRRSEFEIRQYLKRKDATPEDIDVLIDRLYGYRYLDDHAFARAWVDNRRELQKRSNRVLKLELRQKGISRDIIEEVLADSENDEKAVLRALVVKKRRMTRYHDRDKLLAYLLRQGYSYSSVTEVLAEG